LKGPQGEANKKPNAHNHEVDVMANHEHENSHDNGTQSSACRNSPSGRRWTAKQGRDYFCKVHHKTGRHPILGIIKDIPRCPKIEAGTLDIENQQTYGSDDGVTSGDHSHGPEGGTTRGLSCWRHVAQGILSRGSAKVRRGQDPDQPSSTMP